MKTARDPLFIAQFGSLPADVYCERRNECRRADLYSGRRLKTRFDSVPESLFFWVFFYTLSLSVFLSLAVGWKRKGQLELDDQLKKKTRFGHHRMALDVACVKKIEKKEESRPVELVESRDGISCRRCVVFVGVARGRNAIRKRMAGHTAVK